MQKVILSKEYLSAMTQFEGLHRQAYVDPAGYPTIGIGHLIRANEVDKYLGGMSIPAAVKLWHADREAFYDRVPSLTLEEVHDLKRADMKKATDAVESKLQRWGLLGIPQRCLEVATDLAFNAGPGSLDGGFKECLLRKDYDGAVLFSPRYCMAADPHTKKPVPYAGLTFRKYTFVWYYFTGEIWRIGAEGGRDADWKEVDSFLKKLTEILKAKGKANPLPYPNNRREAQRY